MPLRFTDPSRDLGSAFAGFCAVILGGAAAMTPSHRDAHAAPPVTATEFFHPIMYDRTTWIVLALCGALLAGNLYYSGKHQQQVREQQAREQALRQTESPPAADAATVTPEPKAGLTVETPPPPADEQLVVLENDRIAFTLTQLGGGVKYAELKDEFQVGSRAERVRINRFGAAPVGALARQSGAMLETAAYSYLPGESVPGRKAVYITRLSSGLIVKKSFALADSSEAGAQYLLDLDITLENAATDSLDLGSLSLFLGEASPLYPAEWPQQTGFFHREGGDIHFTDGNTFKKGWFSAAKSMTSSNQSLIELAGVTNQFFATVVQPAEAAVSSIWARPSQVTIPNADKPVTSVRAGLQFPARELQPAGQTSLRYRLFIGPKHNPMLRKMENHWGDGWGDVMQYGWFGFVSRPLNWLLNSYHHLLDSIAKNWSWGLAIILLTITVRFVIWPLHAKSTRTMKRMAKLKPEMDKLREKYPNDPNKLNTEMMGLYRKFGINPLGGCLPMFIQIPVFFGFYRMLQYAVELRGERFLWVDDLSQPDTVWHLAGIPINLLPIVMAITSFLQIKMTPMTGDKLQQRIILLMPFMFFFFCYNFASALALYWTTQNLFSIGQTWLMAKIPEPELKPMKGAGKSWMQRMAERQAELEKQRRQGGMRNVTPEPKKKRPPRTGGA
jgi:YidC/Oxa1 family membrane protein insertase